MQYTYLAASMIIDGIALPTEQLEIELYRTEHQRFLLTRNVDPYLATLDRGTAIGTLMLKWFVGQSREVDFEDALKQEISEIRRDRQRKIGSSTVLLLEASGNSSATIGEPRGEHADFIITFDAVDKDAIRRAHRSDIQAMKLAIALETDAPPKFETLTDDVFFKDDSGKTVYSLSFSLSAELSVGRRLTAEGAKSISTRYKALRDDQGFEKVQRLFAQMSDAKSDRFRAFLSGWTALEIFVNKTFRAYESTFLAPLASAGQPSLREKFLRRLKDVVKDKYRLADKFLVISAVLFPDIASAASESDLKRFSLLKNIRDSLSHGEEV